MADEDQETRTRAQREAALKEFVSVFNKVVRNLNKITRSIHAVSEDPDFNPNELKDHSNEYKSTLEELSNVYDKILEVSFDSPPEKVVETYERIDVESCKFMSEVSAQIRESRDQYGLNRSQSDDKQSIEKLCSQMVLGRLPAPEPDVFSGDPLKFTAWFNSFQTLITSRSIPESERIFYLNKYLSDDAKACVEGFLSLCTPDTYHNLRFYMIALVMTLL